MQQILNPQNPNKYNVFMVYSESLLYPSCDGTTDYFSDFFHLFSKS